MAPKRKNIGFNNALNDVVEQLAEKWGITFSEAVRHCIIVVAKQESISPRRPAKSAKLKPGTHQNS